MSPLITQIIAPLCAAFALGILAGWLAKQLHATDTIERIRKTWEERFRRQRQELEVTRQAAQGSTEHCERLQGQLTAANNERQKEELKSLRKNLADKTELQTQRSRRLKEQDAQRAKIRQHEVNAQMQRSRLEFTLRSKDAEIHQLRDRLAAFETQQKYLTESNNNLRHSCARYQSDLHEKDAELERLHARIDHLETHPMPSGLSATPLPMPDLRTPMDVQDKDAEIARLRARIAGLQLLLRRGANRLQLITSDVPVDLARKASLK